MIDYEKVLKEYIEKFKEEPALFYLRGKTKQQKAMTLIGCIKRNESLSQFYEKKDILS